MTQQVKFFGTLNPWKTSFSGKQLFFDDLEKEVNTWLLARPDIELVEIKQSSSGGIFGSAKLVVSVWYKKKA